MNARTQGHFHTSNIWQNFIHIHFEVVFQKIERNFTFFSNLGETFMLDQKSDEMVLPLITKFSKYVWILKLVENQGDS